MEFNIIRKELKRKKNISALGGRAIAHLSERVAHQ